MNWAPDHGTSPERDGLPVPFDRGVSADPRPQVLQLLVTGWVDRDIVGPWLEEASGAGSPPIDVDVV